MTLTARLEADGLEPLALDASAGYALQALDLGDATTRVSVTDAVDADGTIDTTAHVGARAVTLNLKLLPAADRGKEQMRQRLRAFTHPRLRPVLYFSLDGRPERRVVLRRSQWANVVQAPAYAPVVLQFVAPFGIIESAELHEVQINAGSSGAFSVLGVAGFPADSMLGVEGFPAGSVLGISDATTFVGPLGGAGFDWAFDLTFVGGGTIGEGLIVNDGTADAQLLMRIYGPCDDPSIENETVGRTLTFTGLTIDAGHFLEVDTRARTIRYDGNADDSRYDRLDFATSTWWALVPGVNTIRFNPAAFSDPANVAFVYRDSDL